MKAKKPAETARERRTLNCGHKDLEDLAVKAILACFLLEGGAPCFAPKDGRKGRTGYCCSTSGSAQVAKGFRS